MARQNNFSPKFLSTDHGGIQVLHFKPQQHSIAMSQFRIPDRPMMMTNMPAVQLHEQLTIRNQLLVLASTVPALASQQSLVPATARFNISNTNKGLWIHSALRSSTELALSQDNDFPARVEVQIPASTLRGLQNCGE